MRVDVEEVIRINKRLSEINQVPFEEIEWYENDSPLNISTSSTTTWKYNGLTNTYFVTCVLYPELDSSLGSSPLTTLIGR